MKEIMTLKGFDGEILSSCVMADFTTFRLGGPVLCVIPCRVPQDVCRAADCLEKNEIPFIIIGAGSNLVVSDEGLPCAVIRYLSEDPAIAQKGDSLNVGAGTKLDHLALYAATRGLKGLNHLTGIPGTVGGAVVGNAGAFGQQISDSLRSVTIRTSEGKVKEIMPQGLDFGYRDSNLKRSRDVVLSARFSLSPEDKDLLLKERREILDLRCQKHPDYRRLPTAGSFFRNRASSEPENPQAAGWFLERAGAKTFRCGGAYVFEKHANMIVKDNSGTAQEVFDLSQKMTQAVKAAFGVTLTREVCFVGRFQGADYDPQTPVW